MLVVQAIKAFNKGLLIGIESNKKMDKEKKERLEKEKKEQFEAALVEILNDGKEKIQKLELEFAIKESEEMYPELESVDDTEDTVGEQEVEQVESGLGRDPK